MQQYPYDIPTEAFSFEIFKQAFAAIQSCVVHLQVKFPCYPLHIYAGKHQIKQWLFNHLFMESNYLNLKCCNLLWYN